MRELPPPGYYWLAASHTNNHTKESVRSGWSLVLVTTSDVHYFPGGRESHKVFQRAQPPLEDLWVSVPVPPPPV